MNNPDINNTPLSNLQYIPPLHPDWRFLFSHPAHFIALGAGSGMSRLAPGTVGTLWAWAAFGVLQSWFNSAQIGWIIAGTAIVSIWAGMRTAQHLQVADPGSIVIDEIVAFWLILWLITPSAAPLSFWSQLGAFALFRYFDAAKPGPVGWADRAFKGFGWKGGFGILFDDLVAAFCVVLVFAIVRF